MRKPRCDSALLNLPEEQQAKLADWLLSGLSRHEARARVEKEFGVSLTRLAAFTTFWRRICVPQLSQRRRRAVLAAEHRARQVSGVPGPFDLATLDAVKQKAYELAESPTATPKDLQALLQPILKARDQDLAERALDLNLQRFRRDTGELFLEWAKNQQALDAAQGEGSNAEKLNQIGEVLFGDLWRPIPVPGAPENVPDLPDNVPGSPDNMPGPPGNTAAKDG